MRSSTLMLLVAVNAVIAVGVVAVALTLASPEPAPAAAETASAARGGVSAAEVERKLEGLRGDLNDQITQLATDLADERARRETLEKELAEARAAGTVAAAGTPAASPEEKAAVDATRQMMRGMAGASRQMGRRILESLANPTEESIQQAQRRIRMDAQRISRRLNLPEARAAQVEQALLEVDRRTREKMKDTINAKGIDEVTYEDAMPLVEESYKEREQAMTSILSTEELETFKAQEQQTRGFVEMGMRMAFPAKPAEGSEEGR